MSLLDIERSRSTFNWTTKTNRALQSLFCRFAKRRPFLIAYVYGARCQKKTLVHRFPWVIFCGKLAPRGESRDFSLPPLPSRSFSPSFSLQSSGELSVGRWVLQQMFIERGIVNQLRFMHLSKISRCKNPWNLYNTETYIIKYSKSNTR